MRFEKIETIDDLFKRDISLYLFHNVLLLDLHEYAGMPYDQVFGDSIFSNPYIDYGLDSKLFYFSVRLK